MTRIGFLSKLMVSKSELSAKRFALITGYYSDTKSVDSEKEIFLGPRLKFLLAANELFHMPTNSGRFGSDYVEVSNLLLVFDIKTSDDVITPAAQMGSSNRSHITCVASKVHSHCTNVRVLGCPQSSNLVSASFNKIHFDVLKSYC